ncbi:WD repeat domain-containing protein [Xylariaceae sp. FL0255]|nr:WD repeat domain-containing protein [Xylariaceae sp. FL0255]
MAFVKRIITPFVGTLKNDVAVPSDNEDTITTLSWSPVDNLLATASWDNKLRIYDVSGSPRGVGMLIAEGPVFDADWAKDGTTVLAGGADKKNHLLHVATGQQLTLGQHDAAVRGVRFLDIHGSDGNIFASGSWDKTLKMFDVRSGNDPVVSLSCYDRVYSMDTQKSLLVIATAGTQMQLVDLRNPSTILKTVQSSLTHQTKVVRALPDGKAWATGSIEGRVAITHVDDKSKPENFTFRCHRSQPEPIGRSRIKETKIWAVNDIAIHPIHHSICVTAGSDGCFHIWDLPNRRRTRSYPTVPASDGKHPDAITAVSFSHDGRFLAYATGYDWSRGCAGNVPKIKTKVMLHEVGDLDPAKIKLY